MPEIITALSSGFFLGATFFWIVTALLFLIAVGLSDSGYSRHYRSKSGWIIFIIAIWLGLMWFGADGKSIYKNFNFSLIDGLPHIIGYIVVGIIWTIIKWALYVYNWKKEYLKERKYFFSNAKNKQEAEKEWKQSGWYKAFPNFRDHIEKLIDWGILWPFSMLGTLISDGIRKIWELLIKGCSKIFDTITNIICGDIKDKFEDPR
jgi:hypothetical protein